MREKMDQKLNNREAFLQGEGECAELLRGIDWSRHPLGTPVSWSETLKISLGILLNSKFPMLLFWGKELFCFYNDAFRESLGTNGKHPVILVKPGKEAWPESWEVTKSQIDHVLETGEATWHEDQLVPIYRNGALENVYWTYSYSALTNSTGERKGVLVTCIETTDEVENRKELIQVNQRLKRAKEMGGIGDWRYSLETGFLEWSDEMYSIFQTNRETFTPTAEDYLQKVHPDDKPVLLQKRESALEHGETLDDQHRVILDNGTVKWVHQKSRVYTGPDGDRTYEGICQDITTLKELSLELQAKANALEIANEDLEQFAYTASHDLKEPLRMVKSFLELLKKRYGSELDEKAQQYIYFAHDGATRMNRLIDDLLEYSRVGRKNSEKGKVDLNTVVKSVEKLYAAEIESKKAKITAKHLPVVHGQGIPLKTLFQNIIGNSLKFYSEERAPEIRISSEKINAYWKISIADNGIGVEEPFLEKVFQPFKRLHAADQYPGSGMGLAICKKIVDQHEGSIWMEPGKSGGTTIHLTLKKEDQ